LFLFAFLLLPLLVYIIPASSLIASYSQYIITFVYQLFTGANLLFLRLKHNYNP